MFGNEKQKRSQTRQSKTASNTKFWLRVKPLINANCPFQTPKIVLFQLAPFKSCSAHKTFPQLSSFDSCRLNKSLIVVIFYKRSRIVLFCAVVYFSTSYKMKFELFPEGHLECKR